MDFDIVKIRGSYIEQVVDIHMQAFPEFFLTFLGSKFLKEFYESFVYDSAGVGFVAEDAQTGEVLGVAVGPLVPEGYFKRLLKRRWWAFCLASVAAVLKRPIIIGRLLRAVFYKGEAPPGPQRALLSSVAVAPESQGRGIGRALVGRWVEEVRCRGGKGCYLTTDANNNDRINTFYQKLGWKIESTYKTPEGRVMNRYVLDFPEKAEKDAE
ncbi:MAG: GNAT family N-acetyltransferase [Planctomycetota bacterium]|jgi:ribosomal protein S18 acetylase RimI-like enzyme